MRLSFRSSALLAVLLLPAAVVAQVISRSSSARIGGSASIWQTGGKPSNTPSPVFIGFPWDFSGGFGKIERVSGSFLGITIDLGEYGVTVNAGTTGKIGVELAPAIQGGQMDYSVAYSTDWQMPWIAQPGTSVTANVTPRVASGSISATSPTFKLALDGIGRGNISYSTRGAFVGELWNVSGSHGTTTERRQRLVDLTDVGGTGLSILTSALTKGGMRTGFFQPDARAYGFADSQGNLNGKGSGRFAFLDGSLLDMAIAFLPGWGTALGAALEGSYGYGDWRLTWKLAKSYVGADFLMTQNLNLRPQPAFTYRVRDAAGTVIASTTGTLGQMRPLTFTMPNGPVTMETTYTVTPRLETTVGADIGGAIRFVPFYVNARGNFGPGKSFSFTADISKEFDLGSTALGRMAGEQFNLAAPSVATTFAPLRLNPGDPNALTTQAFWRVPDNADAFESLPFLNGVTSDDTLITREIYAQEGTGWRKVSGAQYELIVDNSDVNGNRILNSGDSNTPGLLRFRLDRLLFPPGVRDVKVRRIVSNATTNEWRFPLAVEYGAPNLDGQIFNRSDLDVQGVTNRLLAGAGDQRLYFATQRVFPNVTQLLMVPEGASDDQGVVVPIRKLTQDNRATVEATVPAVVAPRFVGRRVGFKLRNPRVRTTPGTSEWLDLPNSQFLFVAIGAPTVSSVRDLSANDDMLRIFEGGREIVLTGARFTPATTVALTTTGPTFRPPTVVDAPDRMRILLDTATIARLREFTQIGIQATTPTVNIPADAANPDSVSGGQSTLRTMGFQMTSGTLELPRPAVLPRGQAAELELHGDSIFRFNSLRRSRFFQGGIELTMRYPSDRTADERFPSVNVRLTAQMLRRSGRVEINMRNPDAPDEARTFVEVQSGPPRLGETSRVEVDGSTVTGRLRDGLFYDDTTAKIGLTAVPANTGAAIAGSSEWFPMFTASAGTRDALGTDTTVTVSTPAPGGGSVERVVPVYEVGPASVAVTRGPAVFNRGRNSFDYLITLEYGGRHRCDGPFSLAVDAGPHRVLNAIDGRISLPNLGLSPDKRRRTFVVSIERSGSTVPNPTLSLIKR